MPDNPYQLRNATPQDDPEGQLAPYVEPGGHVFDMMGKLLSALWPKQPELGPAWGLSDVNDYLNRGGEGPMLSPAVARQMDEQANSLAGGTAGMVRMGGKAFPNAYLHRALGDPAELDWLANLFQKGRSTQKPTSAVTPSVMSTFGSEPYGLLFNADAGEGQIAHAGGGDLWSRPVPQNRNRYADALDTMLQRLDEISLDAQVGGRTRGYLPDPDSDPDRFMRVLKQDYPRYWKAVDFTRAAARGEIETPGPQKWMPTEQNVQRFDPQTQGLGDVFTAQKRPLRNADPGFQPENELDASLMKVLNHNEIIPNIDRSMLAGVRLPLDVSSPLYGNSNFSRLDQPIYKALADFAEQQHVPIYRWPAEMNQAQQLKGLEDPFAGKWGYPPGRKDYITSSMLKKIFGISELP